MALSIYLDASVIVPTLWAEPTSELIMAWLGTLDSIPVISSLAAGEVSSAIARRVRMRQITESAAHHILADFDAFCDVAAIRCDVVDDDIRSGNRLVRQFGLGLRLPDAIHVALCQRQGFVLATQDRPLARAGEGVGLSVFMPG